jgi:methylmalonyl-CoA mutase cobalamin-binding domain/chain
MKTNTSAVLHQYQHNLAERTVEIQYALQPEVWKAYGDPGREKSVRDVGFHLLYLAEALDAGAPELFIEYLAWVKSLFESLRFRQDILPITLDCMRQALAENLPEQVRQSALEMLDKGAKSLADVIALPPSFIEPDNTLARQFLDLLLQCNRQAASQLILEAVQNGLPVRQVYLQVFQNSQREVGRLWQTNQISVAQEHFCSAATQMVMSQLYPHLFTGERKERRMVMACVGGELHEIGARMVADFLEIEGWDTYFLGANTPPESVINMVNERNADLLGISVTMTFHVSQARELIRKLRQEAGRSTRVMVGGYPFNLSLDLWKQIGADGFAGDAQAALLEAERLTS